MKYDVRGYEVETIINAYYYILENNVRFQEAVQVHLKLSFSALILSLIICIPLGMICAKKEKLSILIINSMNSLRVIPSLAILIIVLPVLGTGFLPALVALTILACPPILINTYLGFRTIDHAIIQSAWGMGMSERQILRKIEVPLAIPLIIVGGRTAAVEVIASATLASFIGGGGLGTFIVNGLGMYNFSLLLVGAIPVALLAVLIEIVFTGMERTVTGYRRV